MGTFRTFITVTLTCCITGRFYIIEFMKYTHVAHVSQIEYSKTYQHMSGRPLSTMSLCRIIVLLSGVALAVFVGFKIKALNEEVPVPVLRTDVFWGAGEPRKDIETIRQFKIHVSDDVSTLFQDTSILVFHRVISKILARLL